MMTKEQHKQAREALGLTQADLAKILMISQPAVAQRESGAVGVPYRDQMLLGYMQRYGLPAEALA